VDKQWGWGSLNVNITFLLINEIVQEKGRVGGWVGGKKKYKILTTGFLNNSLRFSLDTLSFSTFGTLI